MTGIVVVELLIAGLFDKWLKLFKARKHFCFGSINHSFLKMLTKQRHYKFSNDNQSNDKFSNDKFSNDKFSNDNLSNDEGSL